MEKIRKQQGHVVARNHRDCKESEIFVRFEISMLNSYDMTLVRDKYGIEGWGIVLYIMKYLIERRTDCRAPLYVVGEIAHACHKNRRTILQLIADFPSLFEIEAGGKIFSSPYLLRFFIKTSAKKEKSNRSLDKLTNEALDNQEVSFSKNKELEQEQITTKAYRASFSASSIRIMTIWRVLNIWQTLRSARISPCVGMCSSGSGTIVRCMPNMYVLQQMPRTIWPI